MLRGLAGSGYEGIVTDTIPMLRYAPLDASTVLRKLPRRVTLAARHRMPVIRHHPSKHAARVREAAARPLQLSAGIAKGFAFAVRQLGGAVAAAARPSNSQ
jgi:hypothetical protein